MSNNLSTFGQWAFIIGVILAVLAGFTSISALPVVLFVLGLIVGFLNIRQRESSHFLIAVIALLVVGVAGVQAGQLTSLVRDVLNNFIAFVAAAGLVVALKQILAAARSTAAQ